MKLLDTNVFLRYIAQSKTNQDFLFNQLANDFFERAALGNDEFTTSEAVIAEVLYVLTSPNAYAFSRQDAYDSLSRLLSLPGCLIEHQQRVLSALEIWRDTTTLSFVDALCMAMAQQQNHELVTFDTALAKAAGTQRWDLRSTDDATNLEQP